MNKFRNINFRQGKYIMPLIMYVLLLIMGYLVIDLFHTKKADIPDKSMTTTEYLNPELPEARMKGDGIGGKYESMLKSYGKIEDFSALGNIDRNEEDMTESYESKYSNTDIEMLSQLEESRQTGEAMLGDDFMSPYSNEELLLQQRKREQEAMEELNRLLSEARNQDIGATSPKAVTPTPLIQHTEDTERTIDINPGAVTSPSDDSRPQEVVKKVKVSSDYFNTIASEERETNLIKAIIDEDVKAVNGSRVRLRLLDDIEIGQVLLSKGSYLYAQMSGFSGQRVKGSVKSILVDDEIIKVSLSLYDTDGLEGLYIPGSSFRDTGKDVASGAMSNTSSLTGGSTTSGNALSQWGSQALSNALQKSGNAVSKNIRANSAKLKYGTFVYLINGNN